MNKKVYMYVFLCTGIHSLVPALFNTKLKNASIF
jgi:hypothetical protein